MLFLSSKQKISTGSSRDSNGNCTGYSSLLEYDETGHATNTYTSGDFSFEGCEGAVLGKCTSYGAYGVCIDPVLICLGRDGSLTCSDGFLKKNGICIDKSRGCGNGYLELDNRCEKESNMQEIKLRYTLPEADEATSNDNENTIEWIFE